ncbi:MAG: CAP domain-containing protein [Desulfatiglans sp.]|mgnify:CR=1 FL=1|nr:CAP domain-containing protein [Desulfatiglans sp.]
MTNTGSQYYVRDKMLIFIKTRKRYLRVPLLFILFYLYVTPCGGQQITENIIDTTSTWINQCRTQKDIETLIIDQKLNSVAASHSMKMVELDMLSDSSKELGTPFERIKSAGLTDINNLVVVSKAKNIDLLQNQLESPENLLKILSPEMTHMGIGVKQDSAGEFWLTIHMSERAITFAEFILSQSYTEDAQRSITIKGNSLSKRIKVILASTETLYPKVDVDQIILPQPNGDFEITLNFGEATGSFDFEFYVEKDGGYKLMNFFNISI